MKNIVTLLAVALFSIGINVNAQETKPKTTTKTESTTKKACTKDHKNCTAEEKKTCDKTKKACCAAKTEKKA
jgi:hypothetical protein